MEIEFDSSSVFLAEHGLVLRRMRSLALIRKAKEVSTGTDCLGGSSEHFSSEPGFPEAVALVLVIPTGPPKRPCIPSSWNRLNEDVKVFPEILRQ